MKFHLLILIAIMAITSCGNQAEPPAQTDTPSDLESPEIQIEVRGITPGKAYLVGIFADQQYGIDSATIDAAGKMVFQRNAPYQPGYFFAWLPDQSTIQILVDADQKFTMKTQAGSIVQAMEVEGSKDNELLYKHLKEQLTTQPQIDILNQQLKTVTAGSLEYDNIKKQRDDLLDQRKAMLDKDFKANPNAFYTKFKSAGQNPDLVDIRKPDNTVDQQMQVYYYKKQFWDNVDFSDERLLYTPVIHNKLKRYMTELTVQHPDSIIRSAGYITDKVLPYPEYFKFISNWIALNYQPEKTKIMDPEAVYVFMVQNYFTNERAFWSDSLGVYSLQKRAMEMSASLVGKKGPDVKAKDPQGQLRSIYDLKAPYIVIFMFNPECDHCNEEALQLVRLYDEWQKKGIDVFTIGIETDDNKWRDFLTKYGLKGTHVYDPTNVAIYAKYYVNNTPELYVLDENRTIIAKNLKMFQVLEVVEGDRKKKQGK